MVKTRSRRESPEETSQQKQQEPEGQSGEGVEARGGVGVGQRRVKDREGTVMTMTQDTVQPPLLVEEEDSTTEYDIEDSMRVVGGAVQVAPGVRAIAS